MANSALDKLGNIFGVILGTLAGLCVSVSALCLKMSLDPVASKTLLIINISCFSICFPMMSYQKPKWFLQTSGYTFIMLSVNGICVYASILCFFFSIAFVSMGEALALSTTYPPIAAFLAYIVLKEAFRILDVVLLILITIGVFLIAQPEFIFGRSATSSTQIYGVLFGLGSSFFCAIGILITRKLKTGIVVAESIVFIALAGLIGAFLELGFTKNGFDLPCITDVGWMFGSGIFFLMGLGFRNLALQIERVGPVSVAYTGQIGFGFLFDLVLFGTIPTIASCFGGTLIFVSCIATNLVKCLSRSNTGNEKNTND